jgi:DNA-binding MarR family transcriptional regulator
MANTKNTFKTIYTGIKIAMHGKAEDLKLGENIVFLLILALFESMDQVTIFDVKKANEGVKEHRTHKIVSELARKGYLMRNRSNRHFSKSFLSVTEKGLLYARCVRSSFGSLL